ncbi:MAG: hypothetical protein ACFFD9_07805 [Candidatus Thorarchaeota archaeon]
MVLSHEDSVMSGNDSSDWKNLLTADARALLRFVHELHEGGQLEVFQPGPEMTRLKQMVESHRGSLYMALERRVERVRELGGVEVITQKDLWNLIETIWRANVSVFSDTELAILRESLNEPGLGLRSLARKSRLSYSQARRAGQRLRKADVLRMEGLLNAGKLGLLRVLIILESPKLVLSSPYITKNLFVDGSEQMAFHIATIPKERIEDLLNIVRGLRTTSVRVSAWQLSTGKSSFNGSYNTPKTGWNLDVFHWSTQLRKGESHLVVSDSPMRSSEHVHFTAADLKIIDQLTEDFESTASEIVSETGLSESTVFRKRAQLIEDQVVVPRTRVRVPLLSERMLVLSSVETAGNILGAWNFLPVTYLTRIVNLETDEKRVLQLAALPPGTAREIIRALGSWMSRVDDYSAHMIAAGYSSRFTTAAMFNLRDRMWKWGHGNFFDARSYGIVRREAEHGEIPVDLA